MIALPIRKRDVIGAMIAGTMMTARLNIWYNLIANSSSIASYMWLWYLQEPGARAGERLAYFLYPRIGIPWSVRFGVGCGYAVLIAAWTVVVLAAVFLKRFLAQRFRW